MSLLCGMDFSESSRRAAEVAAGLALRTKQPLHLVHALTSWLENGFSDVEEGVLTTTRRALAAEVSKLRQGGAEVHPLVELGSPAEFLPRAAESLEGTLMVVGATGRGETPGVRVGSRADRLAQHAKLPVLVVRDAKPFREWLAGERPLRVVVGLAFGPSSDGTWAWAKRLAEVGAVDLVGVHFYWAPREFQRLGLLGVRSYADEDPEVDRVLLRELQERFPSDERVRVTWRVEANIGSIGSHLVKLAGRERADLIVVGSPHAGAFSTIWEGSIGRAVIHAANVSVACIPPEAASASHRAPRYRSVLVATDFSPAGNAAIEHAFTAVGPTGTVHLVHVLSPGSESSNLKPHDIFDAPSTTEQRRIQASAELRRLIPRSAVGEGRVTEIHVLESASPATAIAQAAERLSVDLICLGTRGPHGLSRVLGSVAEAVVASTHRPSLLVRPQG